MIRNNRLHIVFLFLSCELFFSGLTVQARRTNRARIISGRVDNPPTGVEQLKINKKKLRRLLMFISAIDRSYSPARLSRSIFFLRRMSISSDARVRLVLMIAAVERTARFMKVALLKSLDVIDAHIIYWRSMGNRSISYNLHKSPLKLLTGKSQYQEIGDNLKRLKRLQRKYYILLGHLNDQLNRFNSDAVFEQQISWVCDLVLIMQKMPFIKSKKEVRPTIGGVMNCLQIILRRLPQYKERLSNRIGGAAMPGCFTVKNTLITAVALAVVWYLYKRPGTVFDIEHKITGAWLNFYRNNIAGPVKRIKAALFGGVGKETEVDDIADQFKQVIDKALGHGSRTEHPSIGPAYEEAYVKVVRDGLDGRINDGELTRLATTRDLEPLKQIFREIAENFSQLNRINKNELPWGLRWIVTETKEGENTQIKAIEMLVRVFLIAVDTITLRGKELGEDMNEPIKELITVAQRVIDQSQLTAAIVALVPTGLVTLTGLSMLKKFAILLFGREIYNFRFTRFVLHDLHHLLNVHADKFMEDMDFESQGKLLFYVHQLKRDAHEHVRYDQMHRFLGDIRALSSPEFSTTQKLETIHGVWNTYTFLKAGYRSKHI